MECPPYRVAVRLCWIAADHWPLIEAHYSHLDLLDQRPARFLNLVYAWVLERLGSQEDIDKFKAELNELLPWQSAESADAAELESESFMALFAGGSG